LRAANVGHFDDSNVPITSYIAILNMLVTQYEEQAVTKVLPLCIKEKAAIWLRTLALEIMALMSSNIKE